MACVPSAASDQTSTQASTLHCAPLERGCDSCYCVCQRAGQAHCQLSPLLAALVRATTLCREAAHAGRFLRCRHSLGLGPSCGCLEIVARHHYHHHLRPGFGATCQRASVGWVAEVAVVAVAWLAVGSVAVTALVAEDEPAVSQPILATTAMPLGCLPAARIGDATGLGTSHCADGADL
jgi:hypothetical protein